jgi:hypothetical protein
MYTKIISATQKNVHPLRLPLTIDSLCLGHQATVQERTFSGPKTIMTFKEEELFYSNFRGLLFSFFDIILTLCILTLESRVEEQKR